MLSLTSWPPAVLQGCSNQVIYTHIHQTKKKEEEEDAGNNQSARADVDHDHIIPKPQLMKRISHMGLPHNASHLIQGLSAGFSPSHQHNLPISLCTKRRSLASGFSHAIFSSLYHVGPHACATPSSSFMQTL
jgi:hypothetical protein